MVPRNPPAAALMPELTQVRRSAPRAQRMHCSDRGTRVTYPARRRVAARRVAAALAFCVAIAGCATTPPAPSPPPPGASTWAGRPIGQPPAPNRALRQSLIHSATQEWEFFGRQRVVFKGSEESIPLVGAWEDDGGPYSDRVNAYWRAVGRPRLDGMDCHRPWSAAFISWLMQQAGIPDEQFPATAAHGVYLAQIIHRADLPGRYFVPRRVADYSPTPGDLVCASRGAAGGGAVNEYMAPELLVRANLHCDLVVDKTAEVLSTIGGNVRNSVSRSTFELDGDGRLQPIPRRPWFLILQNRL